VGGYGTPMKIDLGGIIVGALIGAGAVLILPKLFHGGSYGGNYRSMFLFLRIFYFLLNPNSL
jgi:hypothetical protein